MDANIQVAASSPLPSATASFSPNRKTNTLAVFSSIENIDNNAMSQKLQNILPSKQYSIISQEPRDKFYAIHHTQQQQQQQQHIPRCENDSENTEPSFASKTKKNNRGRKRVGDKTIADNTVLSSQQQQLNKQRKKPRQQTKARKDQHSVPSLYQTCVGLWPKSSTLDDLAYDQVKAMSDLLKVRLCQAKFKMMAKLDKDNELFTFLAEEYMPPSSTLHPPIQLASRKRHNKSTMSVVGNGKNLFARHNKFNKTEAAAAAPANSNSYTESFDPMYHHDAIVTLPQRSKSQKERKKKTPKSATPKQKRATTPKRRSAAADVVPITLSDGSSFYVCEPCNKKYKNRNGLAYHLERCKNADKTKQLQTSREQQQQQQQQQQQHQYEESNLVVCCQQQSVEKMALVQCDRCHSWAHSDCVGLSDDNLEDTFYCPNCKENRHDVSQANQVGRNLLQCLLEAQASDQEQQPQQQQQQQMAMRQNQMDQIQELMNHQTPSQQNDTQEEDELLSGLTNQGDDQSSQLHIWDDFNASFDKNNAGEQWGFLDDDEPFSNYDTDMPSSSWNMSDLAMFGQPPSLLFSDNSTNTNDDANNTVIMNDLSASLPISDITTTPSAPLCNVPTPLGDVSTPSGISSNANTPIQTADGLWFQFANFEDDYQCDN
ncbi:hypothetical protein [Parasitella parasitica]|uniref:PHD-type domain-containing protein n=1 Tax=Parasitella parasitica TaxID=35722 RepID=A0A0B7MXS7_9FUNG|nr:hypothetical protein [Parasitella parasitica]